MSQTKAELIKGLNINASAPATALNIDSSGRVGIGTSSPTSTLHIQHPAQTTGYWEGKGLLIHEDAAVNQGIAFYSRGGNEQYIASLVDDATSYLIIGTRKSSSTNSVDALTIRGDGKVGIGTTTPQSPLTVGATTDFGAIVKISRTDANFNSGMLVLGNGNSTSNFVGVWRGDANSVTTGGQYLNLGGYDGIVFAAGNSALGAQNRAMTIDTSGRLLVGTSTAQGGDLLQTFGSLGLTGTTGSNQINFHGTAIEFVNRNGTARAMQFYVGASGGTPVASLSSAGVWTNASDVKNKENIEDISYGIETVKSLIPRQFDIKSNGKHAIGFIAQEVQPLIPELISETFIKATQETHLGLDYGSLAAVLTKALQEAIGRIEILEAEVAALKAQ